MMSIYPSIYLYLSIFIYLYIYIIISMRVHVFIIFPKCSGSICSDVGQPKATAAAAFINKRVTGANVVPHYCKIEGNDCWKTTLIVSVLRRMKEKILCLKISKYHFVFICSLSCLFYFSCLPLCLCVSLSICLSIHASVSHSVS